MKNVKRRVAGRRNALCKGPEVGKSLGLSRNWKETTPALASWVMGKEVGRGLIGPWKREPSSLR